MSVLGPILSSVFHPHDPLYVFFAFVVAVGASYLSLDLAGRIRDASQGARPGWLGAGAVVMGGGIWSMHFIAMLGVLLPVPGLLDPSRTIQSLLIAIISAAIGLYAVFWHPRGWVRFPLGGTIMGVGVATMHYWGMAALKLPAIVSYDVPLVVLSVAIAIVAATVALWLAFILTRFVPRVVAACIMGIAITGMHFTGMAAFMCVPNPGEMAVWTTISSANLVVAGIAAGTIILIVASGVARYDASVRARLVRALQRSQEHLKHAQRVSHTGSIEISFKNGEVVWSEEVLRMLGAEAAGPSNEDFFNSVRADDREKLKNALESCRAGQRPAPLVCHFPHPDGSERIFRYVADPIVDENGEPVGQLSILHDVTDIFAAESRQRELERELQRAQKLEALGTLAGGIAHELNSPIQFVTDNMNFLSSALRDMAAAVTEYRKFAPEAVDQTIKEKFDFEFISSEVPQAIEQSLEGLRRISEIVLAVKRFAHPSGAVLEENNLNDIVRTAAVISKNEWKYVADLVLDLDPDLRTVMSNASELNQVLLNLIVNAAHAIEDKGSKEEKGRITIRTRNTELGVQCLVSDTGIGIKPEHRGKIFDLFFTTKPPGRGTGQGLALVHTIVTQSHQGKIEIDSKVGEGATFLLTFPTLRQDNWGSRTRYA